MGEEAETGSYWPELGSVSGEMSSDLPKRNSICQKGARFRQNRIRFTVSELSFGKFGLRFAKTELKFGESGLRFAKNELMNGKTEFKFGKFGLRFGKTEFKFGKPELKFAIPELIFGKLRAVLRFVYRCRDATSCVSSLPEIVGRCAREPFNDETQNVASLPRSNDHTGT